MLKRANTPEERAGAAVLRWWGGDGAAEVFAHEGDTVLMERATGPGDLMAMALGGRDDEAHEEEDGVAQAQLPAAQVGEGALQRQRAGIHALRHGGALRLLAFGIILLLAELDVGAEAAGLHRDVEPGVGIGAEHAIGALGVVGRQRTGVAAFRIVRAADEGAELAGLQVEPAGAAGRALPDVAAIRARRIDVRAEHLVERIEIQGERRGLADG